MKLKQAIELLEDNLFSEVIYHTPDEKDALKLLIEAGKWRIHCAKSAQPGYYALLPGETQE